MNSPPVCNGRRPRVVVLAGYLHLSNPIFDSLRKQLAWCDVVYYFSKDMLGADINHDSDEYKALHGYGTSCVQLEYTPKWFRTQRTAWYKRSLVEKIKNVFGIFAGLKKYRASVVKDIKALKPDVVFCTSDIFYTSRVISREFPSIPLFLLQPSFLDFAQRKVRFNRVKSIANIFFNQLFSSQPYFGMEILRAKLLVWDVAAYDHYSKLRTNVQKIISPTHIAIANAAINRSTDIRMRILAELNMDFKQKTIVIFTGHFETLYGIEFQREFERMCQSVVKNHNQYNIIVKVHPNARREYWTCLFADSEPNRIRVFRDITKEMLWAIGDIAIATNSYASVEASIAGLLTINYFPYDTFVGSENFISMNKCYALRAKSFEDIDQFIAKLDDPEYYSLCVSHNRTAVEQTFFGGDTRKTVGELVADECAL